MTILALEFSSDRRSVALVRDSEILSEAAEQMAARGTNAFGLTEKVLAEANISRTEIEAIAVGLGPGSYTGIRAAIAIAQGWHLATGAKLHGVSSVEAVALESQATGIFGTVNVVIDAQRGEFYLSRWELAENLREEIAPLKIVSAAEIQSLKMAAEICVGPEMERILFPSAAKVAQLATRQTDISTVAELEPIYLREANFVKSTPPKIVVG
jgi:tRNA threonylcarbamoyladenosine biosynthesis protein TsaB